MKILYLDQSAELGGAELSLLSQVTRACGDPSVLLFEDGALRERLVMAGIPVEVASGALGGILVGKQSGLAAAMMALPAIVRLVRQVARRARAHDVVYANTQKAFVIGALAALLARRPLIWHLHDILDAEHFSFFLRHAAIRLANWRVGWVIANSAATADAFVAGGGNARRISVVHQGIDGEAFRAVPPATTKAIRSEFGGGKPLIGLFGRLTAWKGQEVFIDALAQVPGAMGIIAGGSLFGEEAYAARLHRKVASMGLDVRVKFLGARSDIPALMSAMDVIVHSSTLPEPFGRVIAEGMFAGRPVVASAGGGVLEMITHGETGFLFAPGDSLALATAIHGVLAAPANAAEVAAAGQAHAEQKFSLDAAVAQLDSIVRKFQPPRLRILFLDQTAELGGAEFSLLTEVTNLAIRASVVLLEDGPLRGMLAQAGVTVEVLAASRRSMALRRRVGLLAAMRALPDVLRLAGAVAIRARSHDVIYANSQKALVVGALAALLARRKVVWRLRDFLTGPQFSPWLRRAAVALTNWRAARVIVNSASTGSAFIKCGGHAPLVCVAYPGIDETPFLAVAEAEIASMRAELGQGVGPLIGVFGRLTAWKGQLMFLETLLHLPGAIGVIVGGPLFGEGAYELELQRKIRSLGLAGRVRMLGFRSDIPLLMHAMDVIVHCSIAPEPFGRVVVEGMLAGRPVVASAAGGVMEIIQHGKTGFLFEPGSVAALVAVLGGVLANTAASAAIAAAGRQWARETFTIPAMAKKIEAALHR
jgi:glycosyltransferase involved in cell wall biosynthesis